MRRAVILDGKERVFGEAGKQRGIGIDPAAVDEQRGGNFFPAQRLYVGVKLLADESAPEPPAPPQASNVKKTTFSPTGARVITPATRSPQDVGAALRYCAWIFSAEGALRAAVQNMKRTAGTEYVIFMGRPPFAKDGFIIELHKRKGYHFDAAAV